LEEKVWSAKRAFDEATSDDIVASGEQYLARLEEYLRYLYEHPGAPGHNLLPAPSSSYEAVSAIKDAVRGAIDQAERARNRVSVLLDSFTEITRGAAVETLNAQKYKGRDTWRLWAGAVTDGGGESMSTDEAAEIALRLRREEYIAGQARGADGDESA
jgi:hypothetical protein